MGADMLFTGKQFMRSAGRAVALGTLGLCAGLLAAQTAPAGSDPQALKALENHLDQLKDVHTLETHFVCQKNLAMLDAPLISEGRLWIRKDGNEKGTAQPGAGKENRGGSEGGAVRFSTEHPYLSELILADGKVFGRSQHETEWTTSSQSSRPGLTAIMVQLGGWATGSAGTLTDMYQVHTLSVAQARIPDSPAVGGTKAHPVNDGKPADFYRLTPASKDLAAVIKSVVLAIDPPTGALAAIEITTEQGDVTRYWFIGAKTNLELPPDLFKPTGIVPAPDKQ
jgi:outer membrane lipoprotein-sorting protein